MNAESPLISPTLDHYSRTRLRFERLAAYVNSPDVDTMLIEERKNRPARALFIRAVLATPGLPQFLHEQIGAPGYRRAGYDILGIGFNAVAVSDGTNQVRKYYRRTAGLSESEQQETINTWSAKQALAIEHLGAYTVPQLFSIEQNPLNAKESIVSATQPRIHRSGTINIFQPEEHTASAKLFFESSKQMHINSDSVAVPDIIGKDNVLIEAETGYIKLIDPISLIRTDPGDENAYQRVVRILTDELPSTSK